MHYKILSITPSPALDLSGIVDKLIPNEKSYVHDELRSPGGNGINAARILTRLNIPVLTTGFLGGSIGQEIKTLLDLENVNNNFINIKGHSRICVTVSNKKDHNQTRLTFPGPSISKTEKLNLFRFVKAQQGLNYLIFGGSLPTGLNSADVLQLLRLAKKKKIECIVDCPGHILRELIKEGPLLIKPNLKEFQEATGTKVTSIAGVQKEAQKLLAHVPYICVSSVDEGALLVTRKNSYFGRIPKIKIRSTVGAGDSMVGAMVAQLAIKSSSGNDILRFGLAAAAATLAQSGTAFGSAHEINLLFKKTKVSQI
ncbi:MAG: hexose kinase [Pseudobdellovibrio sp.]